MKMQNQALSNHPAASVSSWPPKLLFLSLLNGASLMQLKAALLMSFAVKLREEGLGELAMTWGAFGLLFLGGESALPQASGSTWHVGHCMSLFWFG